MSKLLPNEKVMFEHFTQKEHIHGFQDSAWSVEIKGITVSIIKFSLAFYNGAYEIFSSNILFYDVERFVTMVDLLKRLTELNSKEAQDVR